MANTAEVNLRGRFPVGTKVELVPRLTDNYAAGAVAAVGSAKTDSDSLTHFDGLTAGDQFWAVADVDDVTRAVAVLAKDQVPGKVRQERPGTLEAQPPPKEPSPGLTQQLKADEVKQTAKPKRAAAKKSTTTPKRKA